MTKINYKIVKDYNPPSEKDINTTMDFKSVLEGVSATPVAGIFSNLLAKVAIGVGLVTAVAISYYFVSESKTDQPPISEIVDIPREPKILNEGLQTKTPGDSIAVDRAPVLINKDLKTIEKKAPKKEKVKNTRIPDEKAAIIPIAFKGAVPIVGYDSLYRYLKTSIIYPLSAPADTLEGTVKVKFEITNDGYVTNAVVIQSMGDLFDQEALRVIRQMPQWKPATKNNEPVVTKKQISIQFRKKSY
ncbi:MAG: energy transducer TonB [Cyclobacteriaceae bacterium]